MYAEVLRRGGYAVRTPGITPKGSPRASLSSTRPPTTTSLLVTAGAEVWT